MTSGRRGSIGMAGGAARARVSNGVTSSLIPRLKRWRSGKEVRSRMQAVKNGEREQCGIRQAHYHFLPRRETVSSW